MRVYISHAAADRKAAEKLANELRAKGFQVVDPMADLGPGDNWQLALGKALEESKAMVALLSPKAVESPWLKKEVEYAITSPRFSGRLVPVMLQKTASYPWILRKLKVVPFDTEAIAARLREAVRPKPRFRAGARQSVEHAA